MKSIKVAIIGLCHLHPRSYMAHFNMIPEMEVIAVAEENESLRTQFAEDFNLRAYSNWQDLFDQEQIDLAAIFLPHVDCPDAAKAAIKKSIHVLIEKPMTVDSQDAEKIVGLAEENNVKVTTPYVWRYHPVVKDIKGLLESGALGEIIGCTGRCAAGRLDRYIEGQAEWMLDAKKSGGGPMYNLGVHWIDLFTWLLGDKVISSVGKNMKINEQYNIEDNSFSILTFRSGAVLTLDISYTVPASFPHGRDLFISIRGTKGVLSWAPAYEGEQDELFICSDAEDFQGAPVQRRLYEIKPVPGYSGIMGLLYLQEVAKSILNDTPVPIPGKEGAAVLKIVESIYQSSEDGIVVEMW